MLVAMEFPSRKRTITGSLIRVAFLVSLLILLTRPKETFGKGNLASEEKEDSSSAAVGESLEEEYLDDEVRFVTEDDFLYEEERSHYRGFYQGSRGARDPHQFERCPPLPDPGVVESSGLCDARKCQSDLECSRDGSVICCYNGCVSTCTKSNPPVAFDWVEETDLKFPTEGRSNPWLGSGPSTRSLLHAEISPEAIALPGGCFLSPNQYSDLALFKKFDHVKACNCLKGEVFCEINHKPLDISG